MLKQKVKELANKILSLLSLRKEVLESHLLTKAAIVFLAKKILLK